MTSKSSTTTEKMPPPHPGEFLSEEFLKPLGISAYKLARGMDVSPMRISEILRGKRGITPDTAIRLGKALGTPPEYWLKLQAYYDLEVARDSANDDTFAKVERVA
jgi:addiction module HigA family antidote